MDLLAKPLKFVKDFLVHPPLRPDRKAELLKLAQAPTDDQWQPGTPMTEVRHCHYTNSYAEMKRGLTEDHNFFEGDIRLEGGIRGVKGLNHFREPIMGHDVYHVRGLSLDEWLEVGQESGRGLKLDIKQAAAVPKIIEAVKEHDIPDEMLIFNADVTRGPGSPGAIVLGAANVLADKTCDLKDFKKIREEFPQAVLSLGAYTGPAPDIKEYSPKQMAFLTEMADELGGPISFPLRADFVTPKVVETMKPHGMVSIWNDPSTYNPQNLADDIRRFREMGVDGMIDLRNTPHLSEPE